VRQILQSEVADFESEHELRELSFDGLSLTGQDFSDKLIEGCSFHRTVLCDVRFNASTIRRCEFTGAGMQGVSLFAATVEESKMMGLDFTRGGRFDGATFTRVKLDYALFRGVDLSDVEFTGCSMLECDFTGADLSNASMIDCDLTDADWAGTGTQNTDLRGSKLAGMDLRRGPYDVIITTWQAVALAEQLGVRVIDPAE